MIILSGKGVGEEQERRDRDFIRNSKNRFGTRVIGFKAITMEVGNDYLLLTLEYADRRQRSAIIFLFDFRSSSSDSAWLYWSKNIPQRFLLMVWFIFTMTPLFMNKLRRGELALTRRRVKKVSSIFHLSISESGILIPTVEWLLILISKKHHSYPLEWKDSLHQVLVPFFHFTSL